MIDSTCHQDTLGQGPGQTEAHIWNSVRQEEKQTW